MKEPYIWNYNIKVKTQDGEYEYERETLDKIEDILQKHQDYTEVRAKRLAKEKRNDGRKNEQNKGSTITP